MADDLAATKNERVRLMEMILWAEHEHERIEIWRRVLKSEGQELSAAMGRHSLVARQVARTLELVLAHQDAFTALIKAAAKKSTAGSSTKSTSASSEEATAR